MSVSVQLGLLFALACAFTSIVGFLYKHRGSVAARAGDLRGFRIADEPPQLRHFTARFEQL